MLGDLARLPENQRAALVLAELGDLSQQEIAATLDVRTDKVKALIFQAREALAGWRQAHAASCHQICEQLATLNGSALRRAPIRRHLAVCPTCAAFEGEVKRQRAALSLLLPVIPGVALKESVLAAALSASHGAAAAGAGTVAAGTAAGAGASGLTAKTLVVAALATGAAGGGGVVAVREFESPRPVTRPAATTPVRSPAVAAPVVRPPTTERRSGTPAASSRPTATSDSKGRSAQRSERARGRSNAPRPPAAGGSPRQRAPPPAASARRRAARTHRPRSSVPAPKTRPAPAPRRPTAAHDQAPGRPAQGEAPARGPRQGAGPAVSDQPSSQVASEGA